MFGHNPRMQRRNSPIAAKTINSPVGQSAKNARMSVGPGLRLTHLAGIPLLSAQVETSFVVRITTVGSGGDLGKYGWQAIQADPDTEGNWIDRDASSSGTVTDDPLYEFNGSVLAVGTRLPAFRTTAGDVRAQYDKCS